MAPRYVGHVWISRPGFYPLESIPARLRQMRLPTGIQYALVAAIPNLCEAYRGCMYRGFAQAQAGRLPSRLTDWFQAELKDPNARLTGFSAEDGTPEVHGPGWLDELERTCQLVSQLEINASDISQLLASGSSTPLRPEASTALASVCTLLVVEREAWTRRGAQEMRTGNLQRRLDIDAIARSRRRLPYWIQLDGLGSPNFDFYLELLELIKRAPEFPRLGHQGKFVESNFAIPGEHKGSAGRPGC